MISHSIPYPRFSFRRRVLKKIGQAIFHLLADVEVHGLENYPQIGPLIVAGNHVGVAEIALMILYTPFNLELIGTGDIPLDPNFAFFARWYGYIPINRGNLDRNGLYQALSVLKQGGVLGIFPEGGVWDPAAMPAQAGIAWISSAGNAPVLPIGFGGTRDAISQMLKRKKPHLIMNIGEILPPVSDQNRDRSRKEALALEAGRILAKIQALVPEEERRLPEERKEDVFSLRIQVWDLQGNEIEIPPEFIPLHCAALAQMLLQPVIMDVFKRNLRLPVDPLLRPGEKNRAHRIQTAAGSILTYLQTNPGFLTYRFGIDRGIAMQAGVSELKVLSEWAESRRASIQILPTRQPQPSDDPRGSAGV